MRQARRRGVGWPGALARVVARLVAGWAAVLLLVVGAGLLVTGALSQRWPLSVEDDAERGIQAARTPLLDRWTDAFSQVADTFTIMGLCAVAVWVLRGRLRRWREALLVAAVTIGQSAVFLSTTLVIDRGRPDVPHLDEAPPTSSFPSGHSSAALALFGSLALVVHRRGGPPWRRRTVVVLLLAVPPLVMAGRMYRGMHHPSDIVGSLLVGGLVLLWSDRVLRSARLPEDGCPRLAAMTSDGAAAPRILGASWGRMEVEGLGVGKDFVLYPGGGQAWDWGVTGMRHDPGVRPVDVAVVLTHAPSVVVLSHGMEGRLRVDPETLERPEGAGDRGRPGPHTGGRGPVQRPGGSGRARRRPLPQHLLTQAPPRTAHAPESPGKNWVRRGSFGPSSTTRKPPPSARVDSLGAARRR